ncbi:MAG: MFS transporter [Proteobacteria bacterium]|nr:MFS transporter [Pseudomonadota bacterium]
MAVSLNAIDAAYPPRAYAWFVVVLLTIAYAISLLDRWIISLLLEPIKAHFGVSDTQMGLLMGPVFAALYVGLGLPLGWLADRYDRRRLIAVAMACWCLMTVCCGLARSFGQLTLARLGVGVGEAGLAPAANSLIADYFPRAEQSRAISFFNMGVATGLGIAYLIGGYIISWMQARPVMDLPLVGELATWQLVFVVAGLPGLIVAAVIAFVREPVRRDRLVSTDAKVTMGDAVRYVWIRRRAFLPLMVGMGTSPLIGYAWNWLPAMFTRTWGWSVTDLAGVYGWILVVFGPLGALSGGWIATALYKRGRKDAPYIATIIALVSMVVLSTLLPLMPSATLAAVLLVPATWAGAMSTAAGVASAVFLATGEVRAQVAAIYMVIISSIGLLLGPSLVGLLNDLWFTDPAGIRYSLSLTALVAGGLLTAYLISGRRHYAQAVAELEAAHGV